MDASRYITHRIDRSAIELLPSGELLIWEAGQTQPIVLNAMAAHAVYLFCRLPGVAPALRKADDARQRQTWEARNASG